MFWDRFVFAVTLGLAGREAVGRGVIWHLLREAFARHRPPWEQLQDLTILLIRIRAEAGTGEVAAATAEFDRRGLGSRGRYLWELLQCLRPARMDEWLEMGHWQSGCVDDQELRRRRLEWLWRDPRPQIVRDLSLFQGRLRLANPLEQLTETYHLIAVAIAMLDNSPIGQGDFHTLLYSNVVREMLDCPRGFPSVLPAGPPPDWYARLEPDEREFIRCATAELPEPELLRFYLHFYARLTAEQLATVLQQTDPGAGWTIGRVALDLERSWMTVLLRAQWDA